MSTTEIGTPLPFTLAVPDSALADLRTRLALTRFPDQAPDAPWAYGTDVGYMRNLVAYWRDGFDWRAQEAVLNAWPQFKVRLHGIDVHYLRIEGKGPNPTPLLLMHGWPGSVFEFVDLIPRLTDPARFGGDPADSFTVIAPSLPGFGLSFAPNQPRFKIEQIAACFADLMTKVLGFPRYAAQGGDFGAFTASRLGYAFPEQVIGIHINLLTVPRDRLAPENPTPEEARYYSELAVWLKEETGYQWIQEPSRKRWLLGCQIHRPGWRLGSSRSSALGRTATVTWKACTAAIGCWRISLCIGSPARSARRSGRTTRACTAPGRFRPAKR